MDLTGVDLDLALLTKKKLELSRGLLKAAKECGLAFYRPSPKQDVFHRAGVRCKRRMVRAGNRFGKSTCGVAEDVAWMLHERLWLKPDDEARRGGIPQHPIKLLTITTDWDKVDEIFTSQRGEGGKVWKFLPTSALAEHHPVRRNHSGAIDTIELRDGSLWRFDTVKSFMANPQGSESSDWDAIHIDEPCPHSMFKASSRGLIDRGGSVWFTLTPLSEFWINDYFFPQDTGGKMRDDVHAINASIYDNYTLSRENIDSYERDLDEDEKQCRLFGLPLHLSGLIYKEFSWEKNVLMDVPKGWDSFELPAKDLPVYLQFDVHPRTPHCVSFCTVLKTGERVYFNDLFQAGSMGELAAAVFEKLDGRRIIRAEMDPLGWQDHPTSESTMADDLMRAGIYVEKATKALTRGILRVKSGLKDRSILFTPAAKRSLWEIQRYCWDEKTNKPLDEDDHAMECLYRHEVSDPRYIDLAYRAEPIGELVIDEPELGFDDLNTVNANEY